MNRKKMIAVIAACIVLLMLISMLIVGIVDGIWPWDGITAYGRLLNETFQTKGEPTKPVEDEEPTDATDETDATNGAGQKEETTTPTSQPTLPNEDEIHVGIQIDGPTASTDSTEGSTEPTNGNQDEENKDYDVGFEASDIPGFLS